MLVALNRLESVLLLVQNSMYVCKGVARLFAGQLYDLHVYDPASQAWTALSDAASGVPPSSRYGHGFTAAGARLFVHGGYNGKGEGDVWVASARVMEWKDVSC